MTIKKGHYSIEVMDDGENALVFIGSFGQDFHVHLTVIGTACDGGWGGGDFTLPKTRVPEAEFKTWVKKTFDDWGVYLTDQARAVRTVTKFFTGAR